jgi:Leucine-rich repeat (LRR) protein
VITIYFTCSRYFIAFLAIQAPILIDAINMEDGCWELIDGSKLNRILSCDMKTIKSNSFANLSSNITILDLSDVKAETIESQAFVGCEHLQQLNIDDNQLTSLPQNVLDPLHSIKEISLWSNQLENFTFDVFANNHNLEKVYLPDNKMTALVPSQHKGEFNIKELYLQDNDLKNVSEVCKLQKLEILNLGGNRNLDFVTFKFSCLTELRTLCLQDTNLNRLNYDYRLFIGIDKLKILDLGQNNLEILCVGNFPALLELEELHVEHNYLTSINVQNLKSKFPKLNRFDMENNPWDCNNFGNLTKSLEAININIRFDKYPTCYKSRKTNESDTFSCLITDEQIRAPFTNYSLLNSALQMVLTVILFNVDITMSFFFYVIE